MKAVPLTMKGVGSNGMIVWHTACSILVENQQDLKAGFEETECVSRAMAAKRKKGQPI